MREGRPAPTVAAAGASLIGPRGAQDLKLQPPKSPVAYFIIIKVTNKKLRHKFPKIRIKIPTLLVETLKKTQRRSQDCSGVVVNDNNTKRWVDPRKFFLSRVNPRILKVFGGKNAEPISSFNGDQHSFDDSGSTYYSNEISNYDSDESSRGSFHSESNPNIFDQNGSNDLGSFSSMSLSSTDSLSGEIYPLFSAFSLATKSPLCDLRGRDTNQSIQNICMACKRPLGEEEEEWLPFGEEEWRLKKAYRASSLCLREEEVKYGMAPLFSCLLGMLNKRPTLNFIKGERRIFSKGSSSANSNSDSDGCFRREGGSCSSNSSTATPTGFPIKINNKRPTLNFMEGERRIFSKGSSSANSNSDSDGCFRRERGSCSSNSSTATPTGFPIKINKKETWVTETEDEDEDNNDHELCKKRILIGERCSLQDISGPLAIQLSGFPAKFSSSSQINSKP